MNHRAVGASHKRPPRHSLTLTLGILLLLGAILMAIFEPFQGTAS